MDLRGLSIKIPKYSKASQFLFILSYSYSPPLLLHIHTHFSHIPWRKILRGSGIFSHSFYIFLSSLSHLIFKIFSTLLLFSSTSYTVHHFSRQELEELAEIKKSSKHLFIINLKLITYDILLLTNISNN